MESLSSVKGMIKRRICLMLLGVATCALVASSLHFPARGSDVSIVPDDAVTVDTSGITVTVFEHTEGVSQYDFTLLQLMTVGGSFRTPALYNETYTVTSDGNNITIDCYRLPPFNLTGVGTGNNIVAVRLNGVPGYPAGLWASVVVSYSLGYGGIAESRFNALGPATQVGPYGDYLSTFMGDYVSEIVLGFTRTTQEITGTLDFDPDTVNLASKGKWVTAYIELPKGYNVTDIVVSSLLLNDVVPADQSHKPIIGDVDHDGIPDLMVKFSRDALQQHLVVGADQRVFVSGHLSDGTMILGYDMIKVIDGGAK